MPKVVPKEVQKEIKEFCKTNTRVDAANKFNLSRVYIINLVNNKKVVRHKTQSRCPITGFLD
jgi:hypothetical protein